MAKKLGVHQQNMVTVLLLLSGAILGVRLLVLTIFTRRLLEAGFVLCLIGIYNYLFYWQTILRRKEIEIVKNTDNGRKNLLRNISKTSEEVNCTLNNVTDIIHHSYTESTELKKMITHISLSTERQADSTKSGENATSELGDLIDQNTKFIDYIQDGIQRVIILKGEGIEATDELSSKAYKNGELIMEIAELIYETNESVNQISSASNMINTISGQTNLLALNASIEAARAGESGKGFAIVALEIQKLAEQTKNSVEKIEKIMYHLQNNSHKAVDCIMLVKKDFNEQTDVIKKSIEKFNGINNEIEKVKETIDALDLAGEDMAKQKIYILQKIADLSAAAQENAAYTQQSLASTEHLSASMSKVVAEAEKSIDFVIQSMNEAASLDNGQACFFYRHDINGVLTYVSPSVTQVLGYTTAEFMTSFTTYLTDNPINQEAEEYTAKSIQGIKQPPYFTETMHKHKGARLLEITEFPIFNGNKQVIGVEGLAIDVTK